MSFDARATIRVSRPQPPEATLEMLRAQCRDELDEQERLAEEDRRRGQGERSFSENLEALDLIGRGGPPHVRKPPGR